jgi:hypothetical protein
MREEFDEPDERTAQMPPEPGLAQREAHPGEGNARPATTICRLHEQTHRDPALKEGVHGGTRGSPVKASASDAECRLR